MSFYGYFQVFIYEKTDTLLFNWRNQLWNILHQNLQMQDTIVSVHVPLIRLMHPVYAADRMPFATPWLDIFWQMARTVCCIDDVSRRIWLVLKTTVASWSYCHMKHQTVFVCTLLSCKSCLSYCCCWVSEKWLDVRFARAISGNLPVDAAVCFRCAIW